MWVLMATPAPPLAATLRPYGKICKAPTQLGPGVWAWAAVGVILASSAALARGPPSWEPETTSSGTLGAGHPKPYPGAGRWGRYLGVSSALRRGLPVVSSDLGWT